METSTTTKTTTVTTLAGTSFRSARRASCLYSTCIGCIALALVIVSSHLVVGCDCYTVPATHKHKHDTLDTHTHAYDTHIIQQKIWDYKSRYDIGYEVATAKAVSKTKSISSSTSTSTSNRNANVESKNEPILLLNGFGVGSFHQHRLIPELLKDDSSNSNTQQKPRTVYCIDYLGQGRSWPKDCMDGQGENEKDLQYSANTWCEQIIDFIEQVVVPSERMQTNDDNERAGTATASTKVHLVGNSVGGHLAAHIAMRRPDLVSSICLLNPTPVWGSKLVGWNGHLPAPIIPKTIGRYLFDRIRDLKTIDKFLESVYSTKEAYTEELMQQIRGATLGNGGHAAFASIMWSAPLQSSSSPENNNTNFQNCLKNIPSDLDVFLVFGQDDPWCKPAFAKNMLKALKERRQDIEVVTSSILPTTTQQQHKREIVQRYVQITKAGHCPNHEAPKAVGHLVRAWVNAKDDDRHKGRLSFVVAAKKNVDTNRDHDHQAMPMPTTSMSFAEEWAEHTVMELDGDDIPLSLTDRIITTFM